MAPTEILNSVMMHWISGATPGLRYYKAAFEESGPYSLKEAFTRYCGTPMGVSAFPREISMPPWDWIGAVCNVQWRREHDRGGHFPSVECPDALVGDLREWFGGGGGEEGVGGVR